jgi:hypothetical protein
LVRTGSKTDTIKRPVRNPIKRSGSENCIFSLLFEERFSASLLFVYHGGRPCDEFRPGSEDSLLSELTHQLPVSVNLVGFLKVAEEMGKSQGEGEEAKAEEEAEKEDDDE